MARNLTEMWPIFRRSERKIFNSLFFRKFLQIAKNLHIGDLSIHTWRMEKKFCPERFVDSRKTDIGSLIRTSSHRFLCYLVNGLSRTGVPALVAPFCYSACQPTGGSEPLPHEGWSRAATVTGAGRVLERTVLFYAQWLAHHERQHVRQFERLANTLHT